MAAETVTAPSRGTPAGSSDAGFSQKIGPLPLWGWALLAAGGAVVWWYFKNKSTAASSTTSDEEDTSGQGDEGESPAGASAAAIQSEVQNLQGEESTEASKESSLQKQENTTSKTASELKYGGPGEGAVKKPAKKTTAKKTTAKKTTAKKTTAKKTPAKTTKKTVAKKDTTPAKKAK